MLDVGAQLVGIAKAFGEGSLKFYLAHYIRVSSWRLFVVRGASRPAVRSGTLSRYRPGMRTKSLYGLFLDCVSGLALSFPGAEVNSERAYFRPDASPLEACDELMGGGSYGCYGESSQCSIWGHTGIKLNLQPIVRTLNILFSVICQSF